MRITIRDLVDLLDYDRTGLRTVRVIDKDTELSDTLQTSSYLLELVEGTAVDSIDVVGGCLTMYISRESMEVQT